MFVTLLRIHQGGLELPRILAVLDISRAIEALTENLEGVVKWLKSIRNTDVVLHLHDALIVKLDDLAARGTDQVIVVGAANGFLVLGMSL